MENENKTRMTFGERRVNSAKEKLNILRERMSENPPKTIIGKKLAIAKLNRLERIIDKNILKNNIKVAQKAEQYQVYEGYYNEQERLMDEVSDLQFEKENILRQLQYLDRFNPASKEFMYATQQRKVAKNMPKGYEHKETKKESTQTRSKIEEQRRRLEERLKEIEEEIAKNEEALDLNNYQYKEIKKDIRKKYKEEKALVAPGPFTKFKNFIKKKVNQFKEWRESKQTKTQEELSATIEKTQGATERELFLQDNAGNLSLEEQARLAKERQERIQEAQGREIDEQDVQQEGPEIVE